MCWPATLALVTFWIAALLRKGSPRIGGPARCTCWRCAASSSPVCRWRCRGDRRSSGHCGVPRLPGADHRDRPVGRMARDPRQARSVQRYTGPVHVGLAVLSLASGIAVFALGTRVGSPLLMGFSLVGLFAGHGMMRKRLQRAGWRRATLVDDRALHGDARQRRRHPYRLSGIGLPRLLPGWTAPPCTTPRGSGRWRRRDCQRLLDRRWRPRAPRQAGIGDRTRVSAARGAWRPPGT